MAHATKSVMSRVSATSTTKARITSCASIRSGLGIKTCERVLRCMNRRIRRDYPLGVCFMRILPILGVRVSDCSFFLHKVLNHSTQQKNRGPLSGCFLSSSIRVTVIRTCSKESETLFSGSSHVCGISDRTCQVNAANTRKSYRSLLG
jgi:hypothetical protein